jgi:hypothetical protein
MQKEKFGILNQHFCKYGNPSLLKKIYARWDKMLKNYSKECSRIGMQVAAYQQAAEM